MFTFLDVLATFCLGAVFGGFMLLVFMRAVINNNYPKDEWKATDLPPESFS